MLFMDIELLKEIGLTAGEIKVYFALLESGSSKTGEISKKSGVHTSKVYLILERLIQKGLASYIIENNVRYYQASGPNQILEFVHAKKRRIDEEEERLRKIIPEILEKQRFAKHKQSAAVYEGVSGIKALFETMLDEWRADEGYLVFTPGDGFENKELNSFFKKHHLKRIERGIIVQSLGLENQRSFYKEEYSGIKNFRFRYIDLSLPAGINIVHNKVSTLIVEPYPTAFVIDSELVAKRYRTFFNNLWKIAKP